MLQSPLTLDTSTKNMHFLQVESPQTDSVRVGAFSPLKRTTAPFEINLGKLSSCGGQPSSLNEELAIDSQQGTLESTDGHYTAASAFASRGKSYHLRKVANERQRIERSTFIHSQQS